MCFFFHFANIDFQKKQQTNKKHNKQNHEKGCPVSEFIEKNRIQDINKVHLECEINGNIKQNGSTNLMIFDVPSLIEYISNYFTLNVGDLILTGFYYLFYFVLFFIFVFLCCLLFCLLCVAYICKPMHSPRTLKKNMPTFIGTPAGVGEVKPGETIITRLKTEDGNVSIEMKNPVIAYNQSKL